MTHTKGKWRVVRDSQKHPGVRNDSGFICFTPGVFKYTDQEERYIEELQERKANAHLIAAAPDLLEACKSILSVINKDKDGSYFICEEAQGEIENLQQAISKAEGT